MKQRNAPSRAPETQCSTEGAIFFRLCGFVQEVKSNDKMKVDYVRFNIKCKAKPEYYDIISVCLPWSLDIELEAGDSVVIQGFVRSWNRGGGISLELVAEKVETIDQAKLTGGKINR